MTSKFANYFAWHVLFIRFAKMLSQLSLSRVPVPRLFSILFVELLPSKAPRPSRSRAVVGGYAQTHKVPYLAKSTRLPSLSPRTKGMPSKTEATYFIRQSFFLKKQKHSFV